MPSRKVTKSIKNIKVGNVGGARNTPDHQLVNQKNQLEVKKCDVLNKTLIKWQTDGTGIGSK